MSTSASDEMHEMQDAQGGTGNEPDGADGATTIDPNGTAEPMEDDGA